MCQLGLEGPSLEWVRQFAEELRQKDIDAGILKECHFCGFYVFKDHMCPGKKQTLKQLG